MPYGKIVQLIPIVLPLGHEQIHHQHKTSVVAGLDQVREFMHHDVLQALRRLFGQIGVQANGAAGGVAAAPLGFHALHEDLPELAALGSRLAKARQINQGMMQELLTGRIRLL